MSLALPTEKSRQPSRKRPWGHCQRKFVYFAKMSEPDCVAIDFPAFFPGRSERFDGEVQEHENPPEVFRRPGLDPQSRQPRPSPQPSGHLQAEPFCCIGRTASADGLNASDQRPSQARSGLSGNAVTQAFRFSAWHRRRRHILQALDVAGCSG